MVEKNDFNKDNGNIDTVDSQKREGELSKIIGNSTIQVGTEGETLISPGTQFSDKIIDTPVAQIGGKATTDPKVIEELSEKARNITKQFDI